MDDLNGRVALVTGGSRGLGQGICAGLAAEGCDVAIGYRSHAAGAAETQRQVEAAGRRALECRADVSRAVEVEAMVAAVERGLGPVDILVNNAGIINPAPIAELTEAHWDDVIDADLKSAYLCTQAVLPGMRRRRWGRVVMISSLAAQVGGLVGPHYSAAKAGMLGLAHCYAKLLAGEGVTVNAVAPALVETDMVRGNPNVTPDLIPVGRFGRVDEHTDVVLTVVRNGYITGQTYNVNGGMYFS